MIRLFGTTPDSNSILAHIHSFTPYLYTPAPLGWQHERDVFQFKSALENAIRADGKRGSILSIQTTNKSSIYGYRASPSPFLRVFVSSAPMVGVVRRLLERGISVGEGSYSCEHTFESNIAYTLRFMVFIF